MKILYKSDKFLNRLLYAKSAQVQKSKS